jgi:hypothetical protein
MNDINKKVFRFDDEMLDAIIKAYESEPMYCRSFGDKHAPYDGRLFHLPCNEAFRAYLTLEDYESFKKFCADIFAHQGSIAVHPLTCGVDSNHELLVPRLIFYENKHVLVCPTCGYVQPMTCK